MDNNKRYDFKDGATGCLVGVVISVMVTFVFSLVFTTWLGWVTIETARVVTLFVWLASIGFGGYWAARRGKSTGWPNSLVVGVLAEWYVASRLLKGTSFLALMDEPGPNWRRLVALALTLPVALLGGLLWVAQTRRLPSAPSSEPPDAATEEPPRSHT